MQKKILVYFFFFVLFSCSSPKKNYHVDVSEVTVNGTFFNFDSIFFSLSKTSNLKPKIHALKEQFPGFTEVYLDNIVMDKPGYNEDLIIENAYKCFDAPFYAESQKSIDSVFSDRKELKASILDLFRHIKYYFPEYQPPKVLFINSLYQYSAFTVENEYLAIGLDRFLGRNYYPYKLFQIYDYVKMQMEKEFLLVTIAEAITSINTPFEIRQKNVLYQALYFGKLHLFIQHLLPKSTERELFKYTETQMRICETNEASIWKFFVGSGVLYSTKRIEISKYVLDAPFTKGLPNEIPGRVLNWIGMKIVKSYMEKYPDLTIVDILEEENYEKIFNLSGYAP